jgi:hypothetical protein
MMIFNETICIYYLRLRYKDMIYEQDLKIH